MMCERRAKGFLDELNVSTYSGGVNLANVQTVGTSTLVAGIPTDGRTIYARLWTKYASTWEAVPYTFTAVGP